MTETRIQIPVRIEIHFGVERRYFSDPRTDDLYTRATGRRIISDDLEAFLARLGVDLVTLER